VAQHKVWFGRSLHENCGVTPISPHFGFKLTLVLYLLEKVTISRMLSTVHIIFNIRSFEKLGRVLAPIPLNASILSGPRKLF